MKYRKHIRYSEEQKSQMWDQWQKGESLCSIARLFHRQRICRYLVKMYITLWIRYRNPFLVKAILDSAGDVPVNRPVIFSTHPGSDHKVYRRLSQLI